MTRQDADRRERWAAWGVVALIAALFAWAVILAQSAPKPAPAPAAQTSAPPAPEPLVFAQIPEADAKRLNDAIPFAADRGPPARPFAFAGAPDSRDRAVGCLASAMWYEAGGDPRGQEAVAQVVLNRVRHPAYPGTVCGVVFQGSERKTGCQFTFTCDGAMARVPPAGAFALAEERARAMLEGRVQTEVGLATHYHTDWVHPIWSAKLEKIAQVDTHLFFRWAGVWGSPAAQRKPYAGGEPVIPTLAFLSPAHRPAPLAVPTGDPLLVKGAQPGMPPASDLGDGRFRLAMSAARNSNVQAATALDLCGTRAYCKLTGVLDSGEVVFVYLRDRQSGIERALWDCAVFKRPNNRQCFDKQRDIPDAPAPKPIES